MSISRLPSPGAGIPTSTVTAKGDLIAGTANNAVSRLGVGANGTTLVADSSEATGLKWATPSSGGTPGLVLISTDTFSAVSSVSVNSKFSSTYDNYLIRVNNLTSSTNTWLTGRLRASGTDETSNNYKQQLTEGSGTSLTTSFASATSWGNLGYVNTSFQSPFQVELSNPFNTKVTVLSSVNAPGGITAGDSVYVTGALNTTTSYDGFTLTTFSGTFTGSVSVYGFAK